MREQLRGAARRRALAGLAGVGLLCAGAVPAVAVAAQDGPTLTPPAVTVPSLPTPTVSVPAVTTPSVTTPAVTTPVVSTPVVSTPTVSIPAVSTPVVSTPTVSTPAVSVPAEHAMTLPTSGAPAGAPAPVRPTAPAGPVARHAAPAPQASGRAVAQPTTVSGRRGGAPSRRAAAAPRVRAGRTAAARVMPATAASAGAPGSAGARPPARAVLAAARTLPGTVAPVGALGQLIHDLPTAFLVALLAFAVIAAAMALNAYLQSCRARSLAGQRESLLSDVGVLQSALLPTVPERVGGLDISVAYRPAQGLAAGGDFFDVFALPDDRTGLIVGDVSGHGRESLVHAALVRYTLRTLMGEGHPLPEVLARADRYLTGELGDGFATVIIGSYDTGTGELRWAKAGHEPPIVVGAEEQPEEAATPLGLGLGDNWPEFRRALAAGERVCFFTDGLVEARKGGALLGRDALRTLVAAGLDAASIVARIEAEADVCGDDLAAVVLSRPLGVDYGDGEPGVAGECLAPAGNRLAPAGDRLGPGGERLAPAQAAAGEADPAAR